jgi:hypothetical protein
MSRLLSGARPPISEICESGAPIGDANTALMADALFKYGDPQRCHIASLESAIRGPPSAANGHFLCDGESDGSLTLVPRETLRRHRYVLRRPSPRSEKRRDANLDSCFRAGSLSVLSILPHAVLTLR